MGAEDPNSGPHASVASILLIAIFPTQNDNFKIKMSPLLSFRHGYKRRKNGSYNYYICIYCVCVYCVYTSPSPSLSPSLAPPLSVPSCMWVCVCICRGMYVVRGQLPVSSLPYTLFETGYLCCLLLHRLSWLVHELGPICLSSCLRITGIMDACC